MDKHKLIIIDGGETFHSDEAAKAWLQACDWDLLKKQPSWKRWIAEGLILHYDIIRPEMPNTMNAKYAEWKIWFEKYLHLLLPRLDHSLSTLERIEAKKTLHTEKISFIGHSLGATFLVKYFSENLLSHPIEALHLVSPAIEDTGLPDNGTLATFRIQMQSLPNLHTQAKHIHIWSSTDDMIVPYDQSVKLHVHTIGSVLHTFHDRGHFVGQAHFVELFQELVK